MAVKMDFMKRRCFLDAVDCKQVKMVIPGSKLPKKHEAEKNPVSVRKLEILISFVFSEICLQVFLTFSPVLCRDKIGKEKQPIGNLKV